MQTSLGAVSDYREASQNAHDMLTTTDLIRRIGKALQCFARAKALQPFRKTTCARHRRNVFEEY